MDHNHCKFLKPRPNFLFSALVALVSASAVSAGEKIRFDDVPQSVTLPSTVLKNQKVQNLTQGEGPANQGGGEGPNLEYMAPAAAPVLISPKLSEMLDKKKNWIFSNPESDADFNSPKNEMSSPGGFDPSRAKGEVERYFERANARKEGEKEKQMRPFENTDSLNRPFERSEPRDRDRSVNSRWDNKLPSMFGSGREDNALSRMEPGSQPLLDGPRLPAFGDPFRPAGFSDPVNLQQDATRDSLNPIFPAAGAAGRQRLDFLNSPAASPVRTSPTDTLSIQATTTFDRARGIADSLNNPILGASGLTPSSSFRPDPVIRSQPPVFEIPRRKF